MAMALQPKEGPGPCKAHGLHINRIIEPQDTIGFHDSIHTFRHLISPFSHAHRTRGCVHF